MKARKHAIIVAHPNSDSFNLSVAKRYQSAVESLGATAVLRDLYRMSFDPCLKYGEIPRSSGFSAAPDVAAERQLIGDADVFALIYPLWFNTPPAILLGYIQRLFGMGFGFGPITQGANSHLLSGRALISFSSSGAPEEWLRSEGSLTALRSLFDEHVAGVCGMKVIDHRHYGDILDSTRRDWIEKYLNDVTETVRSHFSA